MRAHFVLNHGGAPASKLADVELHFEDGLLAGLKLVGCSVWRSKKTDSPTVLVPSRSYATAGGVRYYELKREAEADTTTPAVNVKRFKDYIRQEFQKMILEAEPWPAEIALAKRRMASREYFQHDYDHKRPDPSNCCACAHRQFPPNVAGWLRVWVPLGLRIPAGRLLAELVASKNPGYIAAVARDLKTFQPDWPERLP